MQHVQGHKRQDLRPVAALMAQGIGASRTTEPSDPSNLMPAARMQVAEVTCDQR